MLGGGGDGYGRDRGWQKCKENVFGYYEGQFFILTIKREFGSDRSEIRKLFREKLVFEIGIKIYGYFIWGLGWLGFSWFVFDGFLYILGIFLALLVLNREVGGFLFFSCKYFILLVSEGKCLYMNLSYRLL